MDFEVVITDDSPDEQVIELCRQYQSDLPIRFFRNQKNLNTPENWNEAIRRANGKWIKLIHDDDWFSSAGSLQRFADAIEENPDCSFFFSAYTNVYEGTGKSQLVLIKPFWKKALSSNPNVLIADNIIGPPSVTLHKNDKTIWYDRSMKYIVDIDFYIRYLQNTTYCYVPDSLINVGINNAQVTKYTFGIAEVHLKEALLLLSKTGSAHLNNIIVFDGWWRLIRNFNVKSEAQLRTIGYQGEIPNIILQIIRFQKKIPDRLLHEGILSKALMLSCYSYLRGRFKIF
jgi:glycosyltransferase involved in cell wall biosynthesis